MTDTQTPFSTQTKAKDSFRNYQDSTRHDKVTQTYLDNHTYQTLDFVRSAKMEFSKFKKARMSVWDALNKLSGIVDDSDPDADFTQIYHAFQTAEYLRSLYPEIEWLPLVGLIHDLGKLLVIPEFGGLPQWATVGDTFPVGCAHSPKIVRSEFFRYNDDTFNPMYNTPYGIYQPNCGLANLEMSWGHDEYMYMVCLHNKCTIPRLGLDIIRFHSFYPWHKANAYEHLMSPQDYELKEWVRRFSECDLYSKAAIIPSKDDIEHVLKPYYQSLIEKYFPITILEW